MYFTIIVDCETNLLHIDSDYFTSEMFGRGSGPIAMDYVNCTGSESQLWWECFYFTHYYGCSHSDDVGLRCGPGNFFFQKAYVHSSLCILYSFLF